MRGILAGKKPEGRQRAFKLPEADALRSLFDLALETAMRMSEMYTLDAAQVDFRKHTIFLKCTKNGNKRQGPMTTVAQALRNYLGRRREGQLSPGGTLVRANYPDLPATDREDHPAPGNPRAGAVCESPGSDLAARLW